MSKEEQAMELLSEYFVLKGQDKAIRIERNEFRQYNACERPDLRQEGDCIGRTEGIGGYPVKMCTVCEKRHGWYLLRQTNSRRRGQIMRKLKRLSITNSRKG